MITKTDFTFDYKNFMYTEWSNWSKCSKTCEKSRMKYCRYSVHKSLNFKKCQFKYILEKQKCTEHENCNKRNAFMPKYTIPELSEKCGKSSATVNKIMGGRPSTRDRWPWIVPMKIYNNDKRVDCSATILNRQWAITAAHCLNDLVNKGKNTVQSDVLIELVLNDYYKNQIDVGEYTIYVNEIYIHPKQNIGRNFNYYDFAMLKFTDPIPYYLQIDVPCISDDPDFKLPLDSACYAAGWGSQNTNYFDDRMQEVKLPLVEFDRCRLNYYGIQLSKKIHFCAGKHNHDTCKGDSGGGLYCYHPEINSWMLYGIVSFGTTEGCGNNYGVYARVSAAVNWIRDTIRYN